MTHFTTTLQTNDERDQLHPRRLIASGVKRGSGPLITTPTMTAADRAAHAAASYVRPTAEHERPKTPPSSSRPRAPHPHAGLTPAVTR